MYNKVENSSFLVRYLGIVIVEKLTWREHINKDIRSCGIMHKVKHLIPSDTLNTLYYTLIYIRIYNIALLYGGWPLRL